MIPFTQYLYPFGDNQPVTIERPDNIELLATKVIASGGYFEIEMLENTREISITAAFKDEDIACEVCENGPPVLEAVDKVVQNAYNWMEKTGNFRLVP